MAKQGNQKLKVLYLMQILLQKTDETHTLSMQDLIRELADLGVPAERKSVYDDLEALRTFGLDVIAEGGRYSVGSREFELPELKLLVDSVQSSKFITEKKTLSLIKKIESLASVYDAQLLQRQVYVRGRVKSMNESVYYNVDEISSAITRDRAIRFRYYEYTVTKERRLRHGGAWYEVSPFALMWDDENYYLLGYDAAAGILKHYRVDKMQDISVCETPRQGKPVFDQVDMSTYGKRVFGMFSGQEQAVRLRFAARLAGPVIDRFGSEVMLVPEGEDHFTVTVRAEVSPLFFSWLFAFGDQVEILEPDSVRQRMKEHTQRVLRLYE